MSFFQRGRISGMLLPVLISALFFSSCSRTASKSANAEDPDLKAESEVIQVSVSKAISRNLPSFIPTTGTLIADETSDVAPKASGKIVSVTANVGQFVRQGAVIAKIDDRDARIALAQAKSKLAQAIAGVRQAEVKLGLGPNGKFDSSLIPEVRAAAANFDQAQTELRQAEANEKRYRELVETGDVAMITYEQFRTARDTARSRAANAKQQLEIAVNSAKQNNQAIRTAEIAVDSAKLDVESAEKSVADTVVVAPFSGYVAERPTSVGEFVSTSSIVVKLLRTNPIKAQIQIAEADVPYVVVGRGVSLTVDAYKDRSFAGSVTAVNPSIDANSRSAIIEAEVENGSNALRAGMFVAAKITRDGGTVGVFVPKEAVQRDQSTQSTRVYVIVDGIAQQRTVQIGDDENGMTRILNGVEAEETVATSNLGQLYAGAKVST
ncbi:MAG TPA: efflux RND transporter periplasmic adaptor subunit [Pyrinomonadaceae bacterium]|nr:efflux RND transporter periplasmic adaptor subunit [Pyrinomonadaceae bacterium]